MDATASAAHANLLEPNVLELIHQMEVWYTTALQQQGDESGQVAQGLLTRLKPSTSNQKNTSMLAHSDETHDQRRHSNAPISQQQQRPRNEALTAAPRVPSSTEKRDVVDVEVVDVDHGE